jgi:GPR1/FUN34/yaaH family
VAIFELIQGSSFSFAVFASYGAFWLGWAITILETNRDDNSNFYGVTYTSGATFWLAQWGVLTFCFWTLALRKNWALIIIFTLLALTFWLLAAATATGNAAVKSAGGAFGLLTAGAAWYTGIAELVNEEYGRHVLPGLQPLHDPSRIQLTLDSVMKLIDYDARTNTLFLAFRGLQIKERQHINVIREAVEKSILEANKSPSHKVHVVADYQGTYISDSVVQEYWNMASELEHKYYLSAIRFRVTSFGRTGSFSSPRPGRSISAMKDQEHSVAPTLNVKNDSDTNPDETLAKETADTKETSP